jgi:hypothetical protein
VAVCVVATYIFVVQGHIATHNCFVVIGHIAMDKSFIAIISIATTKLFFGDTISQIN